MNSFQKHPEFCNQSNTMKMKLFNPKYWTFLMYCLLLFSVFHVVRDILQILHIDNIISTSLHTNRAWCNPICDYITFPPEIFIIIAAFIILRRKKFGILGIVALILFLLWAGTFLWSYIYR